MPNLTIYHYPKCSKSRQTLALLEARSIKPDIIDYLQNPPSKTTLQNILDYLQLKPRDIMRRNEVTYQQQQLDDADLTDDQLLQAIIDTPIMLQRPIVTYQGKAAIGRPPENVLEILS